MFRWLLCICCLSLTGAVGCESASSTLLYRDLSDTKWKRKTSPGVPITLEVPTYLKLTIVQRQFLDASNKVVKGADDKAAIVAHDVRQEIINTKKIFTVDLKRPAAGTWESEVDFSGQYFSKIKHKGDDKTIETIGTQVNELIKNILPVLTKARPTVTGEAPGLRAIENVLAVGMFKLDDPELELKVTQFICEGCQLKGAALIAGVTEHAVPGPPLMPWLPSPHGPPLIPVLPGLPLPLPPK